MNRAFVPRVVAGLEPRIRAVTAELVAAARARGHLDLVDDIAYPLPLRVVCDLLGVPYADHELFRTWSAALAEALEPPVPGLVVPEVTVQAAAGRAAFVRYFRSVVAERRARPGDDLVSTLLADGGLSESETIATCVLIINAGHETTVNLIANAARALLLHPEQAAAIRADPSLATGAVEEVLRWDAPVQLASRVAKESLELSGADGGVVRVERDEVIVLLLAAANRDPRRFTDPDTFDVTRPDAGQHLSFSAGAHFCVGAGLARLEGRIVVDALAHLLEDAVLVPGGLEYKPNLSLRGPRHLRVELAGAPARGTT